MMKFRWNFRLSIARLVAVGAIVSLAGCVSYGRTGVLVTPFGVAGIHSFAPAKKSPDDMTEAERTQARIAKAMD